MADATSDVEVRIRATGGAEAADNINKARNAVDNLAQGGTELGDKFGKKLSIIGLTTLNYELLRSIDYGGKAKPVISALNMAWFTLASTIGLSNTALFPYIAAITAVIAIVAKMKGGHDELSLAMSEAQKVSTKLTQTYEEARKGLEDYIEVHGSAPAAFREYVSALKEIEEQENRNRAATLSSQKSILETAEKATRKKIEELTKANEISRKNILTDNDMADASRNLAHDIDGVQIATAGLNAANALTSASIKDNEASIKDLNKNLADTQLELKKVNVELKQSAGGFSEMSRAAEKDVETQKKHNEQVVKLAKSMRDDMIRADKDVTEAKNKALSDRFALEKACSSNLVTMNEVQNARIKDSARDAYLAMMQGFGNSVARMLVDGESFGKNMEKVFKDILRSFISMLVEMQMRAFAIELLGSMGMGVPMFATGTDRVVDRPTLFMAGENGPERVNVAPMNTSHVDNRSSRSVSVNVVNNISGGGSMDTRRLADQIGAQVISRIRGLGDLDFVRG